MVIKAFAKLNLAIDVGEKDETGYHKIDTINMPIDLHDILEIEPILSSQGTFITSDDPALICDDQNLVFKALKAMESKYHFNKSYRIKIYKRIPMSAGLGGGSADAAGLIKALCSVNKLNPSDPEIIALARSIGSDVPYCLVNKPARVTGTGEEIKLLDSNMSYYAIIIKPHKGLSTKEVYDKYDSLPEEEREHPNIDSLINAIKDNDESRIMSEMKNGLYNPAKILCPVVEGILNDLKKFGFPIYAMTGSGNACFGLTKDPSQIDLAKRYFSSLNYITIVTSTGTESSLPPLTFLKKK